VIRRHDTKPSFKVHVDDCDGALDLTGLILEASMWARGRLKKTVQAADTFFALADNIGFEQIMIGDIILVDRPRLPEQMLVIGFDEENNLVEVQRGYHGTTPQVWKKGTRVRIIKFMGASAQTEMIYQDVIQVDGTTKNELTDSFLVYEWGPTDTCLAGCYFMEFKLLKMIATDDPADTPSVAMIQPVYGLVGEPKAYNVYGPHPVGSIYGPFGPFVKDGNEVDLAVNGFHGTNNIPQPYVPHPVSRDETFLEAEYLPTPGIGNGLPPHIDRVNNEGNSPTSPLYPEPLDHSEGANPQYNNPAGVQSNMMAGFQPMAMCDSPSVIPSFTSPTLTPADFGCGLGVGVEWVRRFPVDAEGFLIMITESPTAEL
jgi:hypothetical protein